MPIYEFECPQCSHVLTQLCRLGTDGSREECPKCRTLGLKRMLSRFAAPGTGGDNACGSCTSTACGTCSVK